MIINLNDIVYKFNNILYNIKFQIQKDFSK